MFMLLLIEYVLVSPGTPVPLTFVKAMWTVPVWVSPPVVFGTLSTFVQVMSPVTSTGASVLAGRVPGAAATCGCPCTVRPGG